MPAIDRAMRLAARWLALAAGVVLLAIILLTCISIVGRRLSTLGHSDVVEGSLPALAPLLQGFAPIEGIYDLTEMGVAFAIMAFLPWCQITRAHAKVDVLTAVLPGTANRALAFVWELVFALVVTLIAWRLYEGMAAKLSYGETLYLLKVPFTGEPVPIWWGYAACFAAACVATLVTWWSAFAHALELAGRPLAAGPRDAVAEERA